MPTKKDLDSAMLALTFKDASNVTPGPKLVKFLSARKVRAR
jgi:hypothetical protein